MPVDLDALAVQVGREAVAQVVRDEPGQQPSPETIACVLAGRLDDRQAPRFAILGARAMLAKLREMGLVVESEIRDSFVNELGNHIEIIIRGPTSESTNVLTQIEAEHLSAALAAKPPKGPGHD